MSYTPPLERMRFVIEQVLDAPASWRAMPDFAEVDADLAREVLEQAGRFAQDVIAPLNGPADLQGCPFVMPALSQRHVGMIDHVDTGMTVDAATGGLIPSIAVSSFRNAREIVERTDAISLGHRSQLRDGIASGRLAELTLPWVKKLPTVEMGVAYKRDRTLPPAARTFIALVRRHMRAASRA